MNYSADSIRTMDYITHIRTHPGMYIASKGQDGLIHMVKEIISNSVDEYLNSSECDTIEIILDKENNTISILDNGRGIPYNKKEDGTTTLYSAFGEGMTSGKFDNNTGKSGYNTSGGLNGTGAKAVNALSKSFIVFSTRDGIEETLIFSKGILLNSNKKKVDKSLHGVKVVFTPDEEVLENPIFNENRIKNMIQEFSYLCRGLKFIYNGEIYLSENGLLDYLNEINKGKDLICDPIYFYVEEGKFSLEVALGYNNKYGTDVRLFTNNVPQPQGGTHLTGFKVALTNEINKYARDKKLLKDKDENFTGEELSEGQILILNFKMIDPVFQGQAKEKLTSTEGRTIVQKLASIELSSWLNKNPSKAKDIVEKAKLAKKAKESAKKARETVRKLNSSNEGKSKLTKLPTKLVDCYSKDRSKCELILTEGE